jgi:hypothetical protein
MPEACRCIPARRDSAELEWQPGYFLVMMTDPEWLRTDRKALASP